jgi:hypothetical protein
MRAIIEGKRYDTVFAELIGRGGNGLSRAIFAMLMRIFGGPNPADIS